MDDLGDLIGFLSDSRPEVNTCTRFCYKIFKITQSAHLPPLTFFLNF